MGKFWKCAGFFEKYRKDIVKDAELFSADKGFTLGNKYVMMYVVEDGFYSAFNQIDFC